MSGRNMTGSFHGGKGFTVASWRRQAMVRRLLPMKKRYLWLVRRAYRTLRHPRLRHRVWWRKLTKPLFERRLWKPCRDSVAVGAAIGMFFAVMPMPLQSVAAALIAVRARANVPIAIGACFLSNPFTNVPIWIGQMYIGNFILKHLHVSMPGELMNLTTHLPGVGAINVGSFIVGSIVSGVLLALLAFPLVHLFSAIMPHHLPVLKGRFKISRSAEVPQTDAN